MAAELLDDHDTMLLQEAGNADSAIKSTSNISCSFVSPNFTAFTCDHVVSAHKLLFSAYHSDLRDLSWIFAISHVLPARRAASLEESRKNYATLYQQVWMCSF